MSTYSDPEQILDKSPMNAFQLLAVMVCILLNALDGFDVLAISFASPGIASEWGTSRAALGVVLAMELFGMACGSIALGGIADRIGRRPTILFCLSLMTAGMYTASLAGSVDQLLIARFLTGLGIGGMLATVNAMTAEYSNAKYRNLAVILMATGYPIGVVFGGLVATQLLESFDWRAIFEFGAIITGFFLLVVLVVLPESIKYLMVRRPVGCLDRINKTLKRMGHQTISRLPEADRIGTEASYGTLLSRRYRPLMFLLIVGYFTHIMTFYYILKWIPKIVVDMGYPASSAGTVLVWANVGGAAGALFLGVLSCYVRLRRVLTVILAIAFAMVTAFGLGQQELARLSLVAAITGLFTNAGVVGFYALMAQVFPADVRASGTGMVIGVGRGGAALGPVIAGFMFTAGFHLQAVSVVMGAGAAIAAIAVFMLGPAMRHHQVSGHI